MSNLLIWPFQRVCSSFGFASLYLRERGASGVSVGALGKLSAAPMAAASRGTVSREKRSARKYAEPAHEFSEDESSYDSEDDTSSYSSSESDGTSSQPGSSSAVHRQVSFSALGGLVRQERLSADLGARPLRYPRYLQGTRSAWTGCAAAGSEKASILTNKAARRASRPGTPE